MKKTSTILLTGGAGYIGSHTAIVLLDVGYELVIVDNLLNANINTIKHIKTISGKEVIFYRVDVCDRLGLTKIFKQHKIDAVIHFAGLKSAPASNLQPLKYFDNNVNGTIVLAQVMQDFDCYKLIFSSSAAVYGQVKSNPIDENFPTKPTNPYGVSKLLNEQILTSLKEFKPKWRIGILRYFNPIGAHKSGLIGENKNNIPNNLMPYITRVASGFESELLVFGNDYNTADGSGVRDYIHVMDLAKGHLNALQALNRQMYFVVNLGTGRGYSVLELIAIFEKATAQKIPYKIAPRRKGDVDVCYTDPSLAKTLLNWVAAQSIEQACKDMWGWQIKNQ